jgi:hypothetical protein
MPLQNSLEPHQTPQRTLEPFRWLFVATFKDGSVFSQTQEDISLTRTDGTGSAFTDVREYMESGNALEKFELVNDAEKQVASVDMTTGAFIINGVPFHAHNQYFEPEKYPLKLIYFRETRVDQNVNATIQEDMSIDSQVVGTRHYVNRYFIGWETLVNGQNKQSTIAVG